MTAWTAQGDQWRASAHDATEMRRLGADLAAVLRAGDLVVLDGPLGAGKTTLVQGLAEGLDVPGPITSPTFVIARRHRGPRVGLLHVDAYRVGSGLEIDDLDLDADVAACVTVVEWGVGKVEGLGDSRLEVTIDRAAPRAPGASSEPGSGQVEGTGDPTEDDPAAGERTVIVRAVGARWAGLRLPRQ